VAVTTTPTDCIAGKARSSRRKAAGQPRSDLDDVLCSALQQASATTCRCADSHASGLLSGAFHAVLYNKRSGRFGGGQQAAPRAAVGQHGHLRTGSHHPCCCSPAACCAGMAMRRMVRDITAGYR